MSRIAIVVLILLALYVGGYAWFVRSHIYYSFSSDEIQISDSPLDSALLFVFYPALWFDERYGGIYNTDHFTHFARVYASDGTYILGTQISPFVSTGNCPLPPRPDRREFILICASLICNASLVIGVVYLCKRLNRNERMA